MASTKMQYVRLGTSGVKISKIVLGCMTYGKRTWLPWLLDDEDEAIRQIKAAYDAGINTFDTANSYSNGYSEVILGKAIKEHNLPREEIVVMTKVFFVVRRDADYSAPPYYNRYDGDKEGYVNQHGLSRKHIFDSVKQSLERLQLDYIDVLQCHRFDEDTPIAETMQALHDVVKAGHVRYIGMSVCHAWQFHIMQNYAIQHNLTPFISLQNQYNLLYREEEREMMPTLRHFGVGSIPFAALGRGMLARPLYDQNTSKAEQDRFMKMYSSNTATSDIINRVEEIAKKRGVSMGQIALAWLMGKEGVSAPIIGTSSTKNLLDLIGAVDITLTEGENKYLEEPYQALPVMQ